MVHPTVEQLAEVVPPGLASRSSIDWQPTELALGTELPTDYKELIATFGAGSFDDDFIWLLSPQTNKHLDLRTRYEDHVSALRAWAETSGRPAFDEGALALIPWAFTENGDTFYWVANESADPNEWATEVHEPRGDGRHRFDQGAPLVLAALLTGRAQLPFFPDDFPSADPTFLPHDGAT